MLVELYKLRGVCMAMAYDGLLLGIQVTDDQFQKVHPSSIDSDFVVNAE